MSFNFKGVHLIEDLRTNFETYVIRYASSYDGMQSYTRDGKTICYIKNSKPRVIVENLDHLFHFEVDEMDYAQYGLGAFISRTKPPVKEPISLKFGYISQHHES